MFAYNPQVNDRSGEILGASQTNAANLRAQGMANMGQSIGEGLESMGSSIAEVITKKQEDASKATSIGEALNTMQSTLPTYGAEGVALQQIITKRMADAGNNLDKMSGIYMAFQPAMQNLQSRFNENARIEGFKDLSDYKSSLGADTTSSPRLNADYFRSMVVEAKAAGFSDDAIKSKIQQKYGDYAVRFVYPPQNQGIWTGE